MQESVDPSVHNELFDAVSRCANGLIREAVSTPATSKVQKNK